MAERQACEVYSRVVGYIRPIDSWNEGKKAEFNDRKVFNINNYKTMEEETIVTPEVTETVEHIVTAEDLAANDGALEEAGISEGDVIGIPTDELTEEEIASVANLDESEATDGVVEDAPVSEQVIDEDLA